MRSTSQIGWVKQLERNHYTSSIIFLMNLWSIIIPPHTAFEPFLLFLSRVIRGMVFSLDFQRQTHGVRCVKERD